MIESPARALLEELEQVSYRIANEHRELGQLLLAEKQAKVHGFAGAATLKTISERENVGALQALNITEDIFKARSELASLEARRDYLRVAIEVELALVGV